MSKKCFIAYLAGIGCGFICGVSYCKKEIRKAYLLSEKNRFLFRTATQWLNAERTKADVINYINCREYKSIAVYGLSYLGKVLVDKLLDNNIDVKYGIDNGTVNFKYDIPVYTIEEKLPEVDVIIVTPVFSFEIIKKELSKKINCQIISLADIVFER